MTFEKPLSGRLAGASAWLGALLHALSDAVILEDEDGHWLAANPAALRLLRIDDGGWKGKTSSEIARSMPALARTLAALSGPDHWPPGDGRIERVEQVTGATGEERLMMVSKVPLLHADGRRRGLATVVRDVTDERAEEENWRSLAGRDEVTGLPNRKLFLERLAAAAGTALQERTCMALLLVDLDAFRRMGAAFGPSAVDTLLVTVARRLLFQSGKDDTVARLGGDEFALLLPGSASRVEAGSLADCAGHAIRREIARPVALDGFEVRMSASVGISLFPEDGETAAHLLTSASAALNHAKRTGGGEQRSFSPALQLALGRRRELERRLRGALLRKELAVFYQPQISVELGTITGAEALARWFPSGMDEVPPSEFIPIAEETGLIHQVGAFVLLSAAGQVTAWSNAGLRLPRIAVNVSPIQFSDSGFGEEVEGACRLTGLCPGALELEITERILMESTTTVLLTAGRLRSLGVKLSIDDFGTGFSSLPYLRRLSVDSLKIDRTFVDGIGRCPADEAIVSAIISMGTGLGLRVVAEGVETEEQARYLRDRKCPEFQGFLYFPPLPAAVVTRLLARAAPESESTVVDIPPGA